MASHRLPLASPPDLPGPRASDASIDHALALLLAEETEAALRWGAAALEDGSTPGGLIVTSLLIGQMGRTRAAIEGLESAVEQAVVAGSLPLAVAAIDDLRTLGVEVTAHLDRVSSVFCRGSARLGSTTPPSPDVPKVKPLSPFLTGPALASKAAQILKAITRTVEDSAGSELPPVTPLPLFSELSQEALRELIAAFETITVPAGHRVVREGEVASAAYVVARGELEVSRRISERENAAPLVIARLRAGAFFGEMALVSHLPSAASVVATRPCILLVARREAVEAVAARHPETAAGLAAHCRRQSMSNLGWASPFLAAIPPNAREALVEKSEARSFGKGEKLFRENEEVTGLHLIVSGEVGVIASDGAERVVLATLTAGETVGEVELVLCRRAISDAIATCPTATLFLPSDEFFTLMQDHAGILQALYAVAVRRHLEAQAALESGYAAVDDESAVDGVLANETQLKSSMPPAASVEPPIVPARIVPVEAEAPATQAAARPAATTTMRMHLATPRGPLPTSARPESFEPAPAVSVRPNSTIAPTSTSMAPPVTRLKRSAFQAFAGGAFAAAAGVLIALVAMHGTLGGSPGTAAAGAAVRTEVLPALIDPATSATDSSPTPSASGGATSSAPRVSRAAQPPPAPQRTRVASGPAPAAPASPVAVAKATTAPTSTVTAAAPTAPSAAIATASPEPKPASPKTGTDEFGGRQ